MAHIHLGDGSFSLFWVAAWWITMAVVIGVALFWLRQKKAIDNRRITLAAFCTAAAFAVFQVNIPLYGGVHLNLTPLIGILTGPAIGSLIALIINILSAAIGHGGWGLVGANTLVNIVEVVSAFGIYRAGARIVPGSFARAGLATLGALTLGNCAMVIIILVSGIQGVTQTSAEILAGLSFLFAINLGVAVIEALITGYIVEYIGRLRPDMLAAGAR
jgi:cobalt/nickel transport system permease protein